MTVNRMEVIQNNKFQGKSVKDMTPVEYYWFHKNRPSSKPKSKEKTATTSPANRGIFSNESHRSRNFITEPKTTDRYDKNKISEEDKIPDQLEDMITKRTGSKDNTKF